MKLNSLKFKILEKIAKGFLEYVTIVDKSEVEDTRENSHNIRHYRYLNGLYCVIVLAYYVYAMIILSKSNLSVFNILLFDIILLPIIAFMVKLFVFDNNPFLGCSNIDKYSYEKNQQLFTCPLGFLNNTKKQKVLFFKFNPFVGKNKKDYESSLIFNSNYLDDKEINSFYKIAYSLMMEIEISTAIRVTCNFVLIIEFLVIIIGLINNYSIFDFIDIHYFNLTIYIILFMAHCIYYFRYKSRNSIMKDFILLSTSLKKELIRKNKRG